MWAPDTWTSNEEEKTVTGYEAKSREMSMLGRSLREHIQNDIIREWSGVRMWSEPAEITTSAYPTILQASQTSEGLVKLSCGIYDP